MKPKNTKKIKPTLSDKIADILTLQSKPDIEDDHVFGTKPKTLSRADLYSSDSEDDAIISDFRKRNVNLLSDLNKKYEGSVVSRKNLDESESSESEDTKVNKPIQNQYHKKEHQDFSLDSDFSDDLETENGQKGIAESSDDESDVESDDYSIVKDATSSKKDDEDDDDEEEDHEEGYDVSQMEEPPQEEFEHVKKINVSEEAQKGAAVRNQLLLWEGLLEMRIHLQRCISTANQMPMKDVYDDLKKDNQFVEEVAATKGKVMDVLEKFLSLQQVLLQKYPETKAIASKSNSTETVKPQNQVDDSEEIPSDTENEEIPSDTENEQSDNDSSDKKQINTQVQNSKKRKLDDYEKDLSKTHKLFKTFRDTTIQKWNEKTRLATTANLKSAPTNTILQQISYILSDRDKLIKRTQLKRSEYDIIGYSRPDDEKQQDTEDVSTDRKASDKYILEIFDDSDFYHQLLRELIECKSADISDPVQLSRQWIALQQMRSKMKRKVDTKATKGRKIKYVVHNQLVNYMAPEKCLTWTEESANELYSSLFGKMFEHNNFAAQSQM